MFARSHSDVLSGSILYIQDDLEASSDHFDFVLYDIENVLRPQRADIVVKPQLMKRKTALRVTSQPVVIGLDHLDASKLKVLIVVVVLVIVDVNKVLRFYSTSPLLAVQALLVLQTAVIARDYMSVRPSVRRVPLFCPDK